jgi:type I restriction enzyme M protein
MINNTSSIVSKIWAFCNTLRDDGVGYGCLNCDFCD